MGAIGNTRARKSQKAIGGVVELDTSIDLLQTMIAEDGEPYPQWPFDKANLDCGIAGVNKAALPPDHNTSYDDLKFVSTSYSGGEWRFYVTPGNYRIRG